MIRRGQHQSVIKTHVFFEYEAMQLWLHRKITDFVVFNIHSDNVQ